VKGIVRLIAALSFESIFESIRDSAGDLGFEMDGGPRGQANSFLVDRTNPKIPCDGIPNISLDESEKVGLKREIENELNVENDPTPSRRKSRRKSHRPRKLITAGVGAGRFGRP
jgi:hypothetical protein